MADYGEYLIATDVWTSFALNEDRAPVALSGYRWTEAPGINGSWLGTRRTSDNKPYHAVPPSELPAVAAQGLDQLDFWDAEVVKYGQDEPAEQVAKAHNFLMWARRHYYLIMSNAGVSINYSAAVRIAYARQVMVGALNIRSAPQFYRGAETLTAPNRPATWASISGTTITHRALTNLWFWPTSGTDSDWKALIGITAITDRAWTATLT